MAHVVVTPSLSSMAGELIYEIVVILPLRDQAAMLSTCWVIHDIVAGAMYHRVAVSGRNAKAFFDTVSQTRQDYCTLVRDLTYVSCHSQPFQTLYSFSVALPRLGKLEKLSLSLRRDHATLLAPFLEKFSIPLPTYAFEGTAKSNGHNHGSYLDVLPNLQSFSIDGGIPLIKLVVNHKVTAISILDPIDLRDFYRFVNTAAKVDGQNLLLRKVFLTLDSETGYQKVTLCIEALGRHFPNLECLIIRARVLYVFNVSAILTSCPPLFPRLQSIYLNHESFLACTFSFSKKEALDLQRSHIEAAGQLRDDFVSFQCGTVLWTRSGNHEPWIIRESPSPPHEGLPITFWMKPFAFSTGRSHRPLLWKIIYEKSPAPDEPTV